MGLIASGDRNSLVATANILCVDDEPFIRMMLADCVEELGCAPVEADSGEEALDLLDQNKIDLLISDIRLGGISGWKVAEEARARYPELPVIYISGYPSQGKSVPGAIYLAKPFRPHELEAAIRKCLPRLEAA